MKSIRAKLAIIVIALFIVSLCGLSGLNYWQARNILVGELETELALQTQSYSKEFAAWIKYSQTEVATISRSPILRSSNNATIVPYIAAEVKNNSLYETMLWIDATGKSVNADGVVRNDSERDYFKQAMTGKTVVSGPNVSKGTGKPIISIAVPVRENNHVIGVLAGIVTVEKLEELVLGIKSGDSGYAFVVRGDGLTLIHPDKDKAGKENIITASANAPDFATMANKMVLGERGFGVYSDKGITKYLAYEPIAGTNWSLGINIPVHEATARLSVFAWTSLVTISIVLIVAIGIIFMIASFLVKPLRELTGAAQAIADGDLRLQRLSVNSQDEVGRLARSFETMIENLRSLVKRIGTSSETLSVSTDELANNFDNSAQAVTQVAVAISDATQGLERQVRAISAAMKKGEEIATAASKDVTKMKTATDSADNAVVAVETGITAVTSAVDQMYQIRQVVDNSATVITELGSQSNAIGQIVETISNIAGQTNLLALNAAIEAARAGEQGRGFAVVAEEVRKLAEQSQEAAKKIATLISDIQDKTNHAVKAMQDGTQEVLRGEKVVTQAGKAFDDVSSHIKAVAGIARETVVALEQTAADGLKLSSVLQEAEQISREILNQTETMSAAIEEQSAAMEEVASSGQELAGLADGLKVEIARFKC
ncbi:MAG: mcpA 1 [Firmicutes bacterium]|nr:mcpA 1 [Bacillota bacterium]